MDIHIHKAKYKYNSWYYYLLPRRITLLSSPPIYKWLFWVIRLNKQEYEKILHKKGQNTFIYCPRCDLELISSHSHLYSKNGLEIFKCRQCYIKSNWDFTTPVPILVEKVEE